ncbi:unnamed protein product [Toxocara canis]|uniref:Transposase n=1 Tax=Toxocara canis TaxID=6265 RepID=A0A183V6Q0_TOXCA|nr:unnamed protein product [Toxocara canis]
MLETECVLTDSLTQWLGSARQWMDDTPKRRSAANATRQRHARFAITPTCRSGAQQPRSAIQMQQLQHLALYRFVECYTPSAISPPKNCRN